MKRKDDNLEVLIQRLETKARDMGVLYFGTVDLRPVADFIVGHGGEWLTQFPFAVTAAVSMVDTWVDALSQHSDRRAMMSYHELLEAVDRRWLDIAYELTLILQNSGYKALPIVEHAVDLDRRSVFPHKLAAHLAGFGWIGRNNLLITPERGPRVRLLTVLTTVPLKPTKPNVPLNYDGCGTCRLCVDICPVEALTGTPFTAGIARDALLDWKKCREYRHVLQLARTGAPVCGFLAVRALRSRASNVPNPVI